MSKDEAKGGNSLEVRGRETEPCEIRMTDDGKGIKVSGYAAVFNQEADIGGWFREVIRPGAFSEAIGRDDVVFVINHEGLPLARTRSNTLTLSEDSHGLRMETELLAEDPDVQSIVPKMKRGDLDKMSFAFSMRGGVQTWDESDDDKPELRIIEKVGKLMDVSIVTTPAFEGTDIGLRSLDAHKKAKNYNAAARRLQRKAELDIRARS